MRRTLIFLFCLSAAVAFAEETAAPQSMEAIISVADQRLALVCDGAMVQKYRVSTSKFGIGDSYGSYKTPIGRLRVSEKIGDQLDPGTVIKNRTPTGEILRVNAPGRDPIVTRILWLEGLDEQNRNAHSRGIYIHGTPEERTLGVPKSWGCIRMRSADVMEIYDQLPVGTQVTIIPGHLPRMESYHPPQPVMLAANPNKPVPVAAEKPSSSPPVAPLLSAASNPTSLFAAAPDASGRHGHNTSTKFDSLHDAAVHAMKGSILLAGLPDAPKYEQSSRVASSTRPEAAGHAKNEARQ